MLRDGPTTRETFVPLGCQCNPTRFQLSNVRPTHLGRRPACMGREGCGGNSSRAADQLDRLGQAANTRRCAWEKAALGVAFSRLCNLTYTSAPDHPWQHKERRGYSKDRLRSYPGKPPGRREDHRSIQCLRKDRCPIPRAEWRQQLLLCQRRQHRRQCRRHLRHICMPAGLVDAQLPRRLRASVAGQPSPQRFRPRSIRRVAPTSRMRTEPHTRRSRSRWQPWSDLPVSWVSPSLLSHT